MQSKDSFSFSSSNEIVIERLFNARHRIMTGVLTVLLGSGVLFTDKVSSKPADVPLSLPTAENTTTNVNSVEQHNQFFRPVTEEDLAEGVHVWVRLPQKTMVPFSDLTPSDVQQVVISVIGTHQVDDSHSETLLQITPLNADGELDDGRVDFARPADVFLLQ